MDGLTFAKLVLKNSHEPKVLKPDLDSNDIDWIDPSQTMMPWSDLNDQLEFHIAIFAADKLGRGIHLVNTLATSTDTNPQELET